MLIAVAGTMLAAGIGLTAPSAPRLGPSERSRAEQAIASYAAALHPWLVEGGRVVQLGAKPALVELLHHPGPDPSLGVQAAGWVQELLVVRARIDALTPPTFLTASHQLLETALAGYVTAVRQIDVATGATGARRTELVDVAVSDGNAADIIYDRAQALIAQAQSRLTGG
ncbi:MAG: hypothetical protein ACYDAQ_04025 [Mycobacteriales bacterium]